MMLYGYMAVVAISSTNVPTISKYEIWALSIRVVYNDEKSAATMISARHHTVYMGREISLNLPIRYNNPLAMDVDTRIMHYMIVVLNAKFACSMSSSSCMPSGL